MKTYSIFTLAAIAGAAILTACGGGGGAAPTTTAQPPVVIVPPVINQSTQLVTSVPTPTYTGEKLAVFNRLNEDRDRCGFGKVAQDVRLDVAAQGHADYIVSNSLIDAHNQIAGRSGFTGASIGDRVNNAGYSYSSISEGISATRFGQAPNSSTAGLPYRYPTSSLSLIEDLKNLYTAPYHLASAMSGYRSIGVGYGLRTTFVGTQDFNSSHLVLDYGVASTEVNQLPSAATVSTFPCEGSSGLNPFFLGENPEPFRGVAYSTAPYGQPVYVYATPGQTLNMTAGSITEVGGGSVATRWLNASNDPNSILGSNQWFLAPTTYLKNSTFYDVALVGTNTGLVSATNPTGSFSKNFRFKTGTFTSD